MNRPAQWLAPANYPAPRWAYLGRGLYLAWFMEVTLATPMLLPAFSSQADLLAQRLAFFALYLAACVACAVLWRRVSPARTHKAAVGASSAVGLMGVLIYLLVMLGALPQGAMAASFACAALALPLSDAAWGEAYSYLPIGSVVAMLLGSFALCVALVGVAAATPVGVGAVLLAVQPLASGALLVLALDRSPYRAYRGVRAPRPAVPFPKRRGPAPDRAGAGGPAAEGRDSETAPCLLPSGRFLAGTALLVAAAYLLNGASERVGAAVSYITPESVVLSIAAALVFLVGMELHPERNPARFLSYLGLFEALAYLAFALGGGTPEALCGVPNALVLACSTCIGLIAWLVVIDAAKATKTSPFLTCAVGAVAIAAGKAAGECAALFELPSSDLAAVALTCVAFGVYLAATSAKPETVALPVENALETRAALLAKRFGLTPREREVLVEWASGHNVAYVAETLSISVSTAKTHIAHISQKTSTHGREELLRLLDAVAGPNAG